MTPSTQDRQAGYSPEMRWMAIGWLISAPIFFALNAALTYRPSFDSPGEVLLAVLPFVVFAAALVALVGQLRGVSPVILRVAIGIALLGWSVMMFDDETWSILTFVLFGLCFGAGERLGVALAGLLATVWTVSWAISDLPKFSLAIPLGVFIVGSLIAVTIWRIENTKEVMRRMRDLESAYVAQEVTLRQNDKLATLGRLSAGLAHELNNPTAAVQQAATQLATALADSEQFEAALLGIGLSPEEMGAVGTFTTRIEERRSSPEFLDPLSRSDRETELLGWLEGNGVDTGWQIAPTLVELGIGVADLDTLGRSVAPERLSASLRLVAARHTQSGLVDNLAESVGRIIEIVKALKTYTYLDQAPRQLIDVHEGIDSTLVMLQSRLKPGIEVRRLFTAGLPQIEAYGSELNQVWTNVLDNAIDAMNGSGIIEIETRRIGDDVLVEITDDGAGLPPGIAEQVFDPFVTTKAPGEGTGLGLNISHTIVTHKHGGSISVESEPGRTTFAVRLPISAHVATDDASV